MHDRSRHHRDGHLNVCVLDQNAEETDYGRHARVVAFCPEGKTLYCRVDRPALVRRHDPDYPNLRDPTIYEVLKAARRRNGGIGKGWHLLSMEEWENGLRIDYHFERRLLPKARERRERP